MMYKTGYRLLFWGSLLQFIDVKFMDFDLFGDIIGYILINAGVQNLCTQHGEYQQALPWARLSIVLSVISLGSMYVQATGTLWSPLGLFFLLLSQCTIIVHLLLVYRICTAIYQLAIDQNDYSLSGSAAFRRDAFLFSTAAMLIVLPFILTMTQITSFILLALAAINVLATISILLLIRRAGKALVAS